VSTHIASIGASLPISTATDQPLARSISEAESDQETQPQPTDDSVREERFDRLDREDQLLNQANQIVEHVRSQFAELSRREQRLNNQLSLLDQERRNVRLWIQEFEDELRDRGETVESQEAEIAGRLNEVAERTKQLDERDAAIGLAQDQLQDQQRTFRQQLQDEIEEERRSLVESRRLAEDDRQKLEISQTELNEQVARNQQEHQALLNDAETQLERDRESLQGEITEQVLTDQIRDQRDQLELAQVEFESQKTSWI
jgi:chromosome segregation ATPase